MTDLRFYFDYLSPYAYLAQSQIGVLGHPVAYHPFDIRTLMPDVGNVPTSVVCKPKNRYVQLDLQRWIARYRVPFARNPDIMAIDSRRLLRATLFAASLGVNEPVVTALFAAMWGRPRALLTADDVAAVLTDAGVSHPDIATEIDSAVWNDALVQATSDAVAAGVFGAPTMVVGGEMFFGNDRLDFVRDALEQAA